jgi:replication factor A2
MVSIVGKILSVDKAETKSTYSLEDDSGKIDAVHWIDESTGGRVEEGVVEGSIARVVGSVRAQGDKRYLIVFRICSVIGDEEVDAHKLEILHSKLQIKNMNEKENAAIGANYGLSNSMVGGSTTTSNSSSFGNSKHDSVYKMVSGCDREEGMGRDELFQSLSSKMNKKDVDDALEFLSNEGHVYSTTDEDHFKTTDS